MGGVGDRVEGDEVGAAASEGQGVVVGGDLVVGAVEQEGGDADALGAADVREAVVAEAGAPLGGADGEGRKALGMCLAAARARTVRARPRTGESRTRPPMRPRSEERAAVNRAMVAPVDQP